MAFMKDILTHNIPIWEECAATPFVQEVQTGKLPLEKFKRYMIQDSIYLKNYARIYGKAIFHAATLREIQLYYSMLNFVNDTCISAGMFMLMPKFFFTSCCISRFCLLGLVEMMD